MSDRPPILSLRLESIRALDGKYVVTFRDQTGGSLEAIATVVESAGVRSASIEPDYFMRWNGPAESIRATVNAIVTFVDAHEGPDRR